MFSDKRFDLMRNFVQQHSSDIGAFVQTGAPIVAQATAAWLSFGVTMATAQCVAYGLRISVATPAVSSCVGCVAVGLASALSAQMAIKTRRAMQGARPRFMALETPQYEFVIDAVFGAVLYRALGGRFRSTLPSNLKHAGAFARASVPARGAEYADAAERSEIGRLMRLFGCHHCGRRGGSAIADHQPPNAVVARMNGGAAKMDGGKVRGVRTLRSMLTGAAIKHQQRYYPQCQRCSSLQAVLLRHVSNNASPLLLHFAGPRVPSAASIFVGTRWHDTVPPHHPAAAQHAHKLRR